MRFERELQNEKFLPTVGFDHRTFRLRSERATTELRGLMSVEWIKFAWFICDFKSLHLARGTFRCSKMICRLFLSYNISIIMLFDQLRRCLTVM